MYLCFVTSSLIAEEDGRHGVELAARGDGEVVNVGVVRVITRCAQHHEVPTLGMRNLPHESLVGIRLCNKNRINHQEL